MSIGGPSPLGTLLVQRLDAMLGTTLSQQANVVSGARPDAVTQPGNPERPDPARNETQRHPQDAVDRATAQNEQHGRSAIDKARLDARSAAWLLARNTPNTATTPSAPTTLGQAAKTILALLANFPEQSATIQGRRPLLTGQPGNDARTGSTAGQNAANTTGRGGAAGTASNSSPGASANISDSGSGPLSGAQSGASNAGTGTVGGTAPAMSGAAATGNSLIVSQLAQSLAQAVQTSGMFYESHLSNLTFGKHALADLRQEPQAQAGRSANRADAQSANNPAQSTGTNVGSDASGPRATGESAQAAAYGRGGEAGATQTAASNTASSLPPSSPLSGLDPQTHVLVRQQLEVLANQSFAWRGEAWPGTPLDWEINKREASQDADEQPQTEHWATRLTIHLPELGEVQARLTLSGQQLVMHLLAPESADVLREHSEALRGRFSAQGLQLSQLSVAAEESAAVASTESPDNPAADAADLA